MDLDTGLRTVEDAGSAVEYARRRLSQCADAPKMRHLIAAALLMVFAGAAAATSVILAATRDDRTSLDRHVRAVVQPSK